jgi:hypothetical protein
MMVFRRLLLVAISVQASSQGSPPSFCAHECEPSSAEVSLLQLNGMLQAIESALDLPAPDGHAIHTPAAQRVAHASHLPVQASIPDAPTFVATAVTRDDGHDGHDSHEIPVPAAPHADDPHVAPDAHEPAPVPQPAPERSPVPPSTPSDVPAPVTPTQIPSTDRRVKEGFENAHPAMLTDEKYAYLNELAAFAIGPGIFFLGLLVVGTFGLFIYAYKNDPRVF